MMTNQLPDGQWIRFAMMGEQPGKVHGLAGGRIIQTPSKFDHPDASGEFYWGGVGRYAMVDFAEAQHGRRNDGAAPDGVRSPVLV